jgi:hypothetical protein
MTNELGKSFKWSNDQVISEHWFNHHTDFQEFSGLERTIISRSWSVMTDY